MPTTQRPTAQQIDDMNDDDFLQHAKQCLGDGTLRSAELKRLSRLIRDAFFAEARRLLGQRR